MGNSTIKMLSGMRWWSSTIDIFVCTDISTDQSSKSGRWLILSKQSSKETIREVSRWMRISCMDLRRIWRGNFSFVSCFKILKNIRFDLKMKFFVCSVHNRATVEYKLAKYTVHLIIAARKLMTSIVLIWQKKMWNVHVIRMNVRNGNLEMNQL